MSSEFKNFGGDKESYRIGDLLNMPHFWAGWNNTPHADEKIFNLFKNVSFLYRDNILGIYDKLRKDESEPIPNIENLRQSADIYLNKNKDILNKYNLETSLFVHLRSGDKGIVEDLFVQAIIDLSKKYSNIIILCGIHKNPIEISSYFPTIEESKQNLLQSLDKIKKHCNITIDTSEPDTHLCIMRNCKNLLLHKGGFSAAGGLLFNGDNLFITNSFEPLTFNKRNEEYFEYVKNVKIV